MRKQEKRAVICLIMALMLVAGAAMQLYFAWMIITSLTDEWPEETDGFSEE